jgi:tartrate-resistant acid phosphatase type 5
MKYLIYAASILLNLEAFAQTKIAKPIPITSIAKEKDAFVFFIIGDWGRNGEFNQKDVAAAMKRTATLFEPSFIISTGDNFYSDGVASIYDPQWNKSYENIYTGNDLQIDWWVVLGNHDYRGNPQAEIDYSKISRRWRMPARYFTNVHELKSGKKARFIYTDTSPFVKKYHKEPLKYSDLTKEDTNKQMNWIDSVLAASNEEWKFVIGHHPVFSTGKHGNTQELIDILKPKMEKHGVQAYFCGHDHDLQHQKLQGSEIDYFVSGAGSEVREVVSNDMTKFAQNTAGFAMVVLKENKYVLYFINKNANVIYTYSRSL